MPCRPISLSRPPVFLPRLPPAAWLWCVLVAVSVCDTNVLARVLGGQVAAAGTRRAEEPPEGGEDAPDSIEAWETPTLPALNPFSPRFAGPGIGHTITPACGPLHRLVPDRLPLPVPSHAGSAFPLRC